MSNDMVLNPIEVLEQLKAGAKSPRTQRSLGIVHQVCKEQHERGSPDFSYGTIGKLSGDIGGPQAQPIRNKTGEVYRRLIDIWARYAQGGKKKTVLSRPPTLMDELLMTITDGATRILVASIISERKKLLYENQNLKKLVRDNFILDISDKSQCSGDGENIGNQLDLLPVELDALSHAISPNLMDKMGWAMDERTGAVLNGPLPIFKAGFGTAIKKVLNNYHD